MVVDALPRSDANHGFFATAFSALFGLLGVFMVYRLGMPETIPKPESIRPSFWVFSPLHLYLSRSGFPNGTAVFFLLVAFLMLAKRKNVSAGLSLGLAYTSHYGLLPNLVVLGGTESASI